MPATPRQLRVSGLSTALALLVPVAMSLGTPVPVAAVEDTTPPQGTLTIEGGAAFTSDKEVVLDVPATDDVGVTIVRARVGPDWTDFTYAPQITYSFASVNLAQQILTVEVQWQDAAGNTSGTTGTIWYDTGPPALQQFQTSNDAGPAGTVTFYLGAYEEASGVAAARFSTNGGSSWGSEIPMTTEIVVWDPSDASVGGKPGAMGELQVWAQVRDGTGQWSNVRSTTISVNVALGIAVSASPTTGEPITFSADWASPVTLPAGAMCLWEFMWGDDQSIYLAERNETFGYLMTQGPATAGFCDSWTFTLPWTPVRQYLVSLRVMTADWTTLGEDTLGSSPSDVAFTSSVGSTSRTIKSSNLPMFYVLPDAYELTLGEPAVYRAYALGGASIRTSDVWSIEYVNTPERHPGSAMLTFYPKRTGYITVCLGRDYSAGPQLAACFDPRVRASSGGGSGGSGGATGAPGTTAPAPAVTPSELPGATSSLDPTTGGAGASPSVPASEPASAVASPVPSGAPSEVAATQGGASPLAWLLLGVVVVLAVAAVAMARPGLARSISGLSMARRGSGRSRPGGEGPSPS